MKPKAFHGYPMYSLKVIIGAAILVVVAVVTTPRVFREKLKGWLGSED